MKKSPKSKPSSRSRPKRSARAAGPPPGCPMHAPARDGAYGAAPTGLAGSDLSYNDYLKVPELLALQIPQSSPAHHDEMLFIVIHQAYELWFKLVIHEMESAIRELGQGHVLRAHHFMKRIVEILKLLVGQIHILETMAPIEFLQFRDRLMPASGFQSIQFRELEFLAGLKDAAYLEYFRHRPDFAALLKARIEGHDLRSAYYEMLRKHRYGVPPQAARAEDRGDKAARADILAALRPIYEAPGKHLEVYLLTEALVDFDQYLGLWREHHVRVVERIIGFKRGTGGSTGVGYLKSTTLKKCFPLLWEVRSHLEHRT